MSIISCRSIAIAMARRMRTSRYFSSVWFMPMLIELYVIGMKLTWTSGFVSSSSLRSRTVETTP